MDALWSHWPLILAMAALVFSSAFFSASEAALFCLRWSDRRALADGNPSERVAERLLDDPDRLLSAVLFWNLVVNITYFAISSVIGIALRRAEAPQSMVAGFAMISLLVIIFFSEMLPKSIAVLQPRALAGLIGWPLAIMVRVVDPIMPFLRGITVASQRLAFPRLQAEEPFELDDIDRAFQVSEEDDTLVADERFVLGNIVELSAITAHEWMRPRKQLTTLQSPVTWSDVDATEHPTGFIFLAGKDDDEIVAAVPLGEITDPDASQLDLYAQSVSVVPWCASLADALQELNRQKSDVAVVVNELGESIGVITLHDVWDAVFSSTRGRSARLLARESIIPAGENSWHVDGMTNLRLLEEFYAVELPETHHATLAGVLQELLERLPKASDECDWGPFQIEVLNVDEQTGPRLKLSLRNLPGPTR